MKQLLFIALVILTISCNKKSQEPISIIENFFYFFEKESVNTALDDIFETNEYMMKHSPSDIEHLKESLLSYISVLGKYHGYEILSQYPVGKSIMHYCCVVKYDTQPIRFNFTFYKSSNTWVLYSFDYDNSVIDELNEMAKYHYY